MCSENGRWRATQEINEIAFPDTLVGVITARLDRLSEDDAADRPGSGRAWPRILLSMFWLISWKTRLTLDEAMQRTAAPRTDRERERRPPARAFLFKHILTQQAAYDSVLLSNRRELHRRAAQSLCQTRTPDLVGRYRPALAGGARIFPRFALPGRSRRPRARAYATAEAIDALPEGASPFAIEADNPDVIRRAYEGLGNALAFANRAPEALEVFEELLAYGRSERGYRLRKFPPSTKWPLHPSMRMGQFPLPTATSLARKNYSITIPLPSGAAEAVLIRCQMCTAQADFESVILHMGELADMGRQDRLQGVCSDRPGACRQQFDVADPLR